MFRAACFALTFSLVGLAAAPSLLLPEVGTSVAIDPLSGGAINVFFFVRTDCPITNRYAPEIDRIAKDTASASKAVRIWLVYPDRTETDTSIKRHVAAYHLPGRALHDPEHQLARMAHAAIAPEAAVFDEHGALRYHGRIDDRYISVGRSRPGGALTHDLSEAIAAIEAGKPVKQSETRALGCFLSDIE